MKFRWQRPALCGQTVPVLLTLGVGIVAAMAYDPKRDGELVALDTRHLFEPSTTRAGLRERFNGV